MHKATFITGLSLLALSATVAVAEDLDKNTREQFEKIADSVAMAQTCRQHDYEVDSAGLTAWGEAAVDQAVEGGMAREDAQARLDEEIDAEYARVEEEFERASRMAQSRDHVTRFNRRMKKSCQRLAKHDLAGQYFTEIED